MLLDVVAILSATLTIPYSLVRLGWMRHGSPWFDFSFLHFEWLFDTSKSYWKTHVVNHIFLFAATGVLLLSLVHLSCTALKKGSTNK